jgi:hypothetical protein
MDLPFHVRRLRLMKVPIFATGLTQHYYLDLGDGTGLHLAELNGWARRQHIRDITMGREATVVAHLPAQGWSSMRERARRVLGRPYSLMTWNCEHFARFVAFGERRSGQIAVAVGVGFAAVALLALAAVVGAMGAAGTPQRSRQLR